MKLIPAAASFLIRKLVTIITAITAAIIAAITAAIVAATVPTATIDTARRWSIDSAAGRRRRRSINLAAAAAPVIAAAPVRDGTVASGEEAKCFGLGRNGGGNECEGCRGHHGYPAEFQHHDTSPVIYLAVGPRFDLSLPIETSKEGTSWDFRAAISRYLKI
jgi:hypothetical protein